MACSYIVEQTAEYFKAEAGGKYRVVVTVLQMVNPILNDNNIFIIPRVLKQLLFVTPCILCESEVLTDMPINI